MTGVLLLLAPAVALALLLVLGRYPGSGVLARALERHRPAARRRPAANRSLPRPPRRRRPGGGVLVGLSLAGRAPPAVVAASTH